MYSRHAKDVIIIRSDKHFEPSSTYAAIQSLTIVPILNRGFERNFKHQLRSENPVHCSGGGGGEQYRLLCIGAGEETISSQPDTCIRRGSSTSSGFPGQFRPCTCRVRC